MRYPIAVHKSSDLNHIVACTGVRKSGSSADENCIATIGSGTGTVRQQKQKQKQKQKLQAEGRRKKAKGVEVPFRMDPSVSIPAAVGRPGTGFRGTTSVCAKPPDLKNSLCGDG
jgi:hypothetical protein